MEGLQRQVDGYCERVDATLWAEPVNALTNLAFVVAALVMWHRTRGQNLPLATGLCVVLFAIGIGSGLFHTFATIWAAIADVVPIALFILLYIYAVHRDVWGQGRPWALVWTSGFIPFVALTVPVFRQLPFFSVSAGYWPVPVLIAAHAFALRHRAPETARGLAIGCAILVASLAFRTVDESLCTAIPLGTHFMWHLLNGLMLGWMIEVYRRHVLRARSAAA